MQTNKRLSTVYKQAKVFPFDSNSKLVFFSDCHRGDDSISDEFSRNQTMMLSALEYYYKNGYTYVEVGDGDELWEHTNYKHIRAAHIDVISLMKKFYEDDRMILLYGNHNIFLKEEEYVRKHYELFYDEYKEEWTTLFPGIKPYEGVIFKHQITGQEIFVVHGHQGDLLNDQLWFVNMFFLRYFWRYMHIVGFKSPSSPARNQAKRHKIEKRYSRWIRQNRMILICGHTHRFKYPKRGQVPYFNTGCCIHSKGITAIEVIDNKIMVVQWRMLAEQDGVLRMVRNVIRGPQPIDHFK